jgi:predicted nuclease of restriction endonuclease-like (RecB) superfamily
MLRVTQKGTTDNSRKPVKRAHAATYGGLLADVAYVIEAARHAAARSVNAVMTSTYWLIGRRIVEQEQQGAVRAGYGDELLKRLARDLSKRFGRGFSERNLEQMRAFYLGWPNSQTASANLIDLSPDAVHLPFPLSWSHYARLLAVRNPHARTFYEAEALRGGWTIRQLDRQIQSQFYERTALSRDKAALLRKGASPQASDSITPDEEIKDPYVLEFLGLKDDYSETELENALIGKLQAFLLELGGDFTFVGRQHRLRVGDEWYRVDLLLFHRRLRCLVIIDLKLGKLTHGDAGQMHLYLNYAREHWALPGENPPVELILCAERDHAVAKYALEGLSNKVLAAEYRMTLPQERLLAEEIERSRRQLDTQHKGRSQEQRRGRLRSNTRLRRVRRHKAAAPSDRSREKS